MRATDRRRFFRVLLALGGLQCALAGSGGAAAWAAGAPAGGVTGRFAAPQGWSVAIPSGMFGYWRPLAGPVASGQLAASLVVAQDGAEVVRLDLYAAADARTPRQWAENDAAPWLAGGRGSAVAATRQRLPAWQVDLDKTSQRFAQRHVLVRLGNQMAHLVCQVGAGNAVAVACAAMADDLQPPAGKARQP